MKKEYDFSQGERARFSHPDAELHIPVYLDPDIPEIMRKLAEQKGSDVETIVNRPAETEYQTGARRQRVGTSKRRQISSGGSARYLQQEVTNQTHFSML